MRLEDKDIPADFFGFIDPRSSEDPYDSCTWESFTKTIESLRKSWPVGLRRDELAEWLSMQSTSLHTYRLGVVRHMIELAVNHKKILVYEHVRHSRHVHIIPMVDSRQYVESEVSHLPSGVLAETHDTTFVMSIDELADCISIILKRREHKKFPGLPGNAIRSAVRDECFRELNLAFLGHFSMLRLMEDARVGQTFHIEFAGTHWYVTNRKLRGIRDRDN
jgi:hypothetical protein